MAEVDPLLEEFCLLNNGNICFLNSTIQLLWRIDSVREFLLKITQDEIETLEPFTMTSNYYIMHYEDNDFINNMNHLIEIDDNIDLKNSIAIKTPIYKNVLEALMTLFKEINTHKEANTPISMYSIRIKTENQTVIECFNELLKIEVRETIDQQQDAIDLIQRIFRILTFFMNDKIYNIYKKYVYKYTQIISCGENPKTVVHRVQNYEYVWKVPIKDLQESNHMLSNLIEKEQEEEKDAPQDTSSRCDKINKFPSYKQYTTDLFAESKTLIISLVRAATMITPKITTPIIPDKTLVINKKIYTLQGCIIHSGEQVVSEDGTVNSSGHYIYYVYDRKGSLKKQISDATIRDIREEDENIINSINSEGYVFLYKHLSNETEQEEEAEEDRDDDDDDGGEDDKAAPDKATPDKAAPDKTTPDKATPDKAAAREAPPTSGQTRKKGRFYENIKSKAKTIKSKVKEYMRVGTSLPNILTGNKINIDRNAAEAEKKKQQKNKADEAKIKAEEEKQAIKNEREKSNTNEKDIPTSEINKTTEEFKKIIMSTNQELLNEIILQHKKQSQALKTINIEVNFGASTKEEAYEDLIKKFYFSHLNKKTFIALYRIIVKKYRDILCDLRIKNIDELKLFIRENHPDKNQGVKHPRYDEVLECRKFEIYCESPETLSIIPATTTIIEPLVQEEQEVKEAAEAEGPAPVPVPEDGKGPLADKAEAGPAADKEEAGPAAERAEAAEAEAAGAAQAAAAAAAAEAEEAEAAEAAAAEAEPAAEAAAPEAAGAAEAGPAEAGPAEAEVEDVEDVEDIEDVEDVEEAEARPLADKARPAAEDEKKGDGKGKEDGKKDEKKEDEKEVKQPKEAKEEDGKGAAQVPEDGKGATEAKADKALADKAAKAEVKKEVEKEKEESAITLLKSIETSPLFNANSKITQILKSITDQITGSESEKIHLKPYNLFIETGKITINF